MDKLFSKNIKTQLANIWMWIEYYCYGKWVGGYFHPSSLEIVEIEIKAAKKPLGDL